MAHRKYESNVSSANCESVIQWKDIYIHHPRVSEPKTYGAVHYSDVIKNAIASQITGVSFMCSNVCSGKSKKTSKLRVTGLCEGNPQVTGGFPSQRTSNAENVSIWWRHHACDWFGFFCGSDDCIVNGVFYNSSNHNIELFTPITFNSSVTLSVVLMIREPWLHWCITEY